MISREYQSKIDLALDGFIKQYKKNKKSVTLDFRNLVCWFGTGDRATHQIHPYPAKLLPHIPYFFINSKYLSKPNDLILDPFCGSGTVLLESLFAGRKAIGIDANPLACLISKTKTKKTSTQKLKLSLKLTKKRYEKIKRGSPTSLSSIEYWYYPHVKKQLERLKKAIDLIKDDDVRRFFLIGFSHCARKVSLADPSIPVPVKPAIENLKTGHWLKTKLLKRNNWLKRVQIWNVYESILNKNIKRMFELNDTIKSNRSPKIIFSYMKTRDSKTGVSLNAIKSIKKNTIQLIVTSPPYAGAQKYIRSSKLNLAWLGYGGEKYLRDINNNIIGREDYAKASYELQIKTGFKVIDKKIKAIRLKNKLRAHIASTYLIEMKAILRELYRVLKINGYMVLVVGNNNICGSEFDTKEYLGLIAKSLGFKLVLRAVDNIKSRGLMTKRNKTASVITREWIMIFKKSRINL